jgi:hypothetical protein
MATFITFQKRVVNWDANEAIVEEEPVATPAPSSPVTAETSSLRLGQTDRSLVIQPKPNNRNGHRSEMVRKLNDGERVWLKNKFIQKNGQIANDDCVAFKGQMISDVIAIFQITGYISVLHRYVALGRLELRDLSAYLNWMEFKYQGLWSQYNNERFTAIRRTNTIARVRGRQPTANIPIEEVPIQTSAGTVIYAEPVFKTMPRRAAYFKA